MKYTTISLIIALAVTACNPAALHIAGNEDNDLVRILQEQKIEVILHDTPEEAVQKARPGGGVLILAGDYPASPVQLDDELFDVIRQKKLKTFIEFPDYVPGISLGEVTKARHERAVVSSGFFGSFPDSLSVLGINGLHYLKVSSFIPGPHLVAAKVAGFDSAIFGLPAETIPLLFQLDSIPVLVATTNVSRFVSGRYAPSGEWGAIWEKILTFVQPGLKGISLKWKPVVGPAYDKQEELPRDFQRRSVQRGVEWYKNARMLIPEEYTDTLQAMVLAGKDKLRWDPAIPVGDGSKGVFECIFSEIDEKGRQPIGIMERGDCVSETAMAFATAGRMLGNPEYLATAQRLLDYYLIHSVATKREYGDPRHGAYGLIPWGISNEAWFKASYGDDNARFLLAAWATAALTGESHWDETFMKSLIALLRTTGTEGFRGSRINLADFEKNGWRFYYERDIINPAPHFECYLWACYLWAYDKTGDRQFLEQAKKGIRTTMDHYPGGWRWTNGIAQEKARMILPLSWLVRVEDNDENRNMLMTMVSDFLELQDQSGAIREELGDLKMGRYPPPQSNEAYGTNEASLIARNGDPVSDLLYTTNFAFLGLHEAAYATKDPRIEAAADKLAEFLCRIQVRSEGHPEVDGGWMRAFDYERFEHWGSNADHGWGAWAIETGWTQGWITAILALREMDTSIWDLTRDSGVAKYHVSLKKQLIPAK